MTDIELPGNELIEQGLRDLDRGAETVPSLLVTIAAPRLRRLGLPVVAPPWRDSSELRLYALLRAQAPRSAYSDYNALIRRIVSFARALEARRGKQLRAARGG